MVKKHYPWIIINLDILIPTLHVDSDAYYKNLRVYDYHIHYNSDKHLS